MICHIQLTIFSLEEVYFKNSALMYSEEGMMATRRIDINASIGWFSDL